MSVNQQLVLEKSKHEPAGKNQIVIGNRVPRKYFVTKGRGESDITIHAGSYHLALKEAGIEARNHMTYSSIMPGIAEEIKQPSSFVHGEVMESIMAVAHSEKGERASAGIIIGWLYNKKTGKRFGGLVCEHNGNYSEKETNEKLKASLNELYYNGYSEKYYLKDIRIIVESFVPEKKHGTALVGICFVDYVYPVLK